MKPRKSCLGHTTRWPATTCTELPAQLTPPPCSHPISPVSENAALSRKRKRLLSFLDRSNRAPHCLPVMVKAYGLLPAIPDDVAEKTCSPTGPGTSLDGACTRRSRRPLFKTE